MLRSCHCMILLALLFVTVTAGFALAVDETAPRAFAPVQEGFTTQSEMTLPYAPDRILVQFHQVAMDKAVTQVPMVMGAQVPDARIGYASVDALVEEAARLLVRVVPEQVQLDFDTACEDWRVKVHPIQLHQVILFSQAIVPLTISRNLNERQLERRPLRPHMR